MKLVPIMRVKDMAASLQFYTQILDFELKYPGSENDPVINIIHDEAELQLSILDGVFGNPVNVRVNNVDALFMHYLSRGLDTSGKKESPVHQGPVDQSWGLREFYVNDPDGNTLRFGMPVE
jgi:catechol 2,3-dioxygenase-like lactoylglutathione lyase family enzyme